MRTIGRGTMLLLLALMAPPAHSVATAAGGLENSPEAWILSDPRWNAAPDGRLPVIVALAAPTTFDVVRDIGHAVADSSPAAAVARDAAFEAVAAAQEPALRAIEASGASVVSTYDTAMNGFLVLATREQILRMAAIPGLDGVYPAPEHRPLLANAVPLVGGEMAMQELGLTGRNVTIAIVDTGIDYTHLSLGGSGRPRDFQENNPRTVEARSFPTEKVSGGYDFAGSYYTGGNMPTEDADPLDEGGHGTHVSGIAAGATGNRKVFHGMAPEARLIALKVFGAQGGTNLVTDAVEWAIEANMGRRVKGACLMPGGANCRVDVLNMSLGAAFANDVMEQQGVMRRAVEAGIVVVAAAGNDEDVAFVTGAPAASDVVVSVANTFPSGQKGDVVQIAHDGATEDIEALEADASLARQMTEVGNLSAPLASLGRGCPGDTPVADVAGKVALIPRGDCSFREKLEAAAGRGAVGALVYNNEGGLVAMGAEPPSPVAIPAYAIGQADGDRLRALIEGGAAATARLSASLNDSLDRSALTDVISPSSSRGPSRVGTFKPNVSAPGTQIVAPYIGRGDEGIALTGTSMASPIVAGAAALLVQRLRDEGLAPRDKPLSDRSMLTAHDVGAMLMNYADATVWERDNRDGRPVPLARQGVGRLNVFAAARGHTVARAGAIAEIGLGFRAVATDVDDEVTVTVRNVGAESRRYAIASEFATSEEAAAGVTYQPSADTLAVGPGQSQEFKLRAHAAGRGLRPYTGYGGNACMSVASLSNTEVDAFVTVTEVDDGGEPVDGGDRLRVPIYFAPRPASGLVLSPDPILVSPSRGQAELKLANGGAAIGRADLYAAVGSDPVENRVDPRINVDVVAVRRGKDARGQDVLDFLVHVAGAERVPLDSQTHIFVDTNGDGEMDHAVYTQIVRVGQQYVVWSATSPVVRQDPITMQPFLATDYYANVDLNTRILSLPVRASRLGLAQGQALRLKAIVVRRAQFSDVVGGRGNLGQDYVPDDGIRVNADGQLSAGPGRIALDEAAASYSVDQLGVEVAGGESARLVLARRSSIPPTGDLLLAVFRDNRPGATDMQLVRVLEGEPPAPTAEPPTSTATAESGATPTAAPTSTPTTPRVWRFVYLPAVAKAFARLSSTGAN